MLCSKEQSLILQLTIKALVIFNCCEPSNTLIINKGIFQLAWFTLKLSYSKEVGPSSVERTNFLWKKKERKMLHREREGNNKHKRCWLGGSVSIANITTCIVNTVGYNRSKIFCITSTVTVTDSNQPPFNKSSLSFASYIWIRVLHLIQCIVYIPVECTVL